jgi:hypothetical protein
VYVQKVKDWLRRWLGVDQDRDDVAAYLARDAKDTTARFELERAQRQKAIVVGILEEYNRRKEKYFGAFEARLRELEAWRLSQEIKPKPVPPEPKREPSGREPVHNKLKRIEALEREKAMSGELNR